MKSRKLLWVAIAASAVVSLGRVSQSKTASPGALSALEDSARAACPAVPSEAPPIAGLKTVWAIRETTTSGVRLLFADHPVECRNPDWHRSLPDDKTCVDKWLFAFTLPPERLQPGVYDLHDYEADYAESVVTTAPGEGCGSGPECMGGAMGSAGGGKGPDSTIEIYSANDECVTGRILRLQRSGLSQHDFTGAFQAVICSPSSP
jgi:hypothetical protein